MTRVFLNQLNDLIFMQYGYVVGKRRFETEISFIS